MKILILGHSNSIARNGYVRGLIEELGEPTVVNYSVGYSPGTQFAYYGSLDFSTFDLVVFDSLANDEMYVEAVGGWELMRDLYYELFSTIISQTKLLIVGFFRRPLDAPVTDAFYLQEDLATLLSVTFVDVRDYVLEHGSSILTRGEPLMLDEAHPHDAIAREMGRHIGKLVAAGLPAARATRNFSMNFHGIEAADLFRGEVAHKRTALMSRHLAVLREGDEIEFDRDWPVVGLFVDMSMTKGFVVLEGPHGALPKSFMFDDRDLRLEMRFIPTRAPVQTRRLVCTAPHHLFEPTMHALDARPGDGLPVISLHGVACWSGSSHDDLPIKRRGAITFRPTRQKVRATDDIELLAPDMPVGRGWRAHQHGGASRGTGPDTPSVLAFDFEAGRYEIELCVLGAAAPGAVETLSVSADGRPVQVDTVYDPVAGLFRCWMALEVRKAGPVDLLLTVPQTKNGYGLEVAGIRVSSHDALSVRRRDAAFHIVRQTVRATDDLVLLASDMPVGRGWREPGTRPDGVASRGTGPGTPSVLAFDFEAGRYEIELHVLGAATPGAVETVSTTADGRPLPVDTVYDSSAGLFRCWMTLEVEKSGPVDISLTVPQTRDGHGLEVAGVRVSPRNAQSIKRRDVAFQVNRKTVRVTDDIELQAAALPVGRGWRDAGQRADGNSSRGTGPGPQSVLAFDFERGRYDIELQVLGAATPGAVEALSASADGQPVPVETVYDPVDGLFRCWMALKVDRSGPVDLSLTAPQTKDGYGLEVGGLRVSPSNALSIKRRDEAFGIVRRLVRAADHIELLAPDMPVGRGWRAVGMRSDGVASRGTGPGTQSVLAFDFERGRYEIELRVLGAVTPEALASLEASADNRPLAVQTVYDAALGLFRCSMDLGVDRTGPVDLLLAVPLAMNGYGLEVAGVRLAGERSTLRPMVQVVPSKPA